MKIYIPTQTHTHIHTHTHTHAYIYVCTYMYVCVRERVRVCEHTCMCVYHRYKESTFFISMVYMCVNIHVCII